MGEARPRQRTRRAPPVTREQATVSAQVQEESPATKPRRLVGSPRFDHLRDGFHGHPLPITCAHDDGPEQGVVPQ